MRLVCVTEHDMNAERKGACNTDALLTTQAIEALDMAENHIPYDGPIVTRDEAIMAGGKKYFLGTTCAHGHLAQRFVSGTVCTVCKADRGKKWRSGNVDYAANYRADNYAKLEAYRADRYAKNREQAKADAKAWSVANPERKAATSAEYRAANSEKISEVKRAWQSANPERRAAAQIRWRNKNPEISRAIVRNRRARVRNIVGSHTAKETEAILELQKFKCANCGCSLRKNRHLDHVYPIALGGSNDITNLEWLCPKCNQRKGHKDPIDWARQHGRLL